MVDTPTKISSLPAGSALSGPEIAPFVQSGATVKITANQIATFVLSPAADSGPVLVGSLTPPVLPDGNDQTANLQAAIDTYSAASGAVLQFGIGTYIFNSAIILKPNIILRGLGIDITILKIGVDNMTLIDRWNTIGNDSGIAGVEQMTVWGYADRNGFTQAASSDLVNMGPFEYYWMRTVKAIYSIDRSLTGFGAIGIVENCVVNKSLRDGINLSGTTFSWVMNNTLTEIGDDAIAFNLPITASSPTDYSTRVIGNHIEKSYGIKLLGAMNAVILNNMLRFYYGYGVQIGEDIAFSQGLVTQHNLNIIGNTLEDGINSAVIGGGNVKNIIWFQGEESLGSAPNAITQYVGEYDSVLQKIQTPDAFINQLGATWPRGPTGAVSVIGNTIRQTLSDITNFSDAGYGDLWNSSGPIDPALTTLIGEMNGIFLGDDLENIVVSGNTLHGVLNGITADSRLTNASITGNTIFRVFGNAINLDDGGAGTNGSIDITNNLIDVDPYLESLHRTSPIDGTWTVSDGSNAMGVYTNYNGVTITKNRFRNCVRAIKYAGGNYIFEKNFLEFDWSSGNKGISSPAGNDACVDMFWFCDSDPTSVTFNQYSQDFALSAGSMPNSGYWYKGTFVRNGNPSIDGNDLIIWGWIRLTSDNNNVLGTDWAIAYVSNVTPAT